MAKSKERRIKEIIKNLHNTYCRLKPSKIHGVGVFAIRRIPKGIDPFIGVSNQEYWNKISEKEINKLPRAIRKAVKDFFIKEGNVFYVPDFGLNGLDISFYTNHSKEPNMIAKNGGEYFIAKRNIKAGEELTVDYNTYDEGKDEYRK